MQKVCVRMTSAPGSESPALQRAIALLEEALGILDALGLPLAAAKLAGVLDMAIKEQPENRES